MERFLKTKKGIANQAIPKKNIKYKLFSSLFYRLN
jgi:hypothetical protein